MSDDRWPREPNARTCSPGAVMSASTAQLTPSRRKRGPPQPGAVPWRNVFLAAEHGGGESSAEPALLGLGAPFLALLFLTSVDTQNRPLAGGARTLDAVVGMFIHRRHERLGRREAIAVVALGLAAAAHRGGDQDSPGDVEPGSAGSGDRGRGPEPTQIKTDQFPGGCPPTTGLLSSSTTIPRACQSPRWRTWL
jgi:hypothetical protein